ncbi:hypothetical protein [Marinilabilia rubra]|uniref:Outer membrane protein beta-barrel domain-containing protein n=1 Tax=Marinilabilia rubra TaxID=2162893 RepID=A0A2U2BD06_9BACT|nr:hypothetical protein [Marinilabilia rubra]PWE00956.1 hypothetical protein DDZ16_00235 [Marinilabilia rubra]
MKRLILLIISLFIYLSAPAQQDLRNGYIIKNTRDTIHGKIDFRGDIKNSQSCTFYSGKGKKQIFLPFDINAYRFSNGKYYISKYIAEDSVSIPVFAEYLVKGEKDLLYFRDTHHKYYLLSINDSSTVKIPYKEKIIRSSGRSYLRKSTTHIGFLKSYFRDCPELFGKIKQIKEPNAKNLTSITTNYHSMMGIEDQLIAYQKKKHPLKIRLEPKVELTKFTGNSALNLYGGLIYIWLPKYNERLFLKTGVLGSDNTGNGSLTKIPLQIKYLFPDKIIRPKFEFGINIFTSANTENHEGFLFTMAPSAGLMIKATKSVYVDLNLETDIAFLIFKPEAFISRTMGVGVLFFI